MAEVIHELPIQAAPDLLYRALTHSEAVSRWWLPNAKLGTREGDLGIFPLSDGINKIEIQIVKLVPEKEVVWRCLHHKFPEWLQTIIRFEILTTEAAPGESVLRFSHSQWQETTGVFGRTSFYRAALYLRNLKNMFET